MQKRRALLVGVPEYESSVLEDLPVVRRDLEILHAAVEQSGYSVRTMGTDGIEQTGQNKLLRAFRKELLHAKGLDVLLLYFSGHGIHYEGNDYLLPSDADFDDPAFVQYLITPDAMSDAIDQCDAKTIVFFIDACRHGVKLGTKDIGLTNWSRGEIRKAHHRSYVLVFSCGPGQVSQYVASERGASLFSTALAAVIDVNHPATKLGEVLDMTQRRLAELITENSRRPQDIYRAYESAVGDDITARIICDSAATAKQATIAPWTDAVLQSSLWPETGIHDCCPANALKNEVSRVVGVCWQQWQAAIRAFPDDAWRDERLPIRVLEALEMLVLWSNPAIQLSAAEIALVIAVPFVREAVLASSIVQAAAVAPLSLERVQSASKLRQALEKIHQTQQRFERKAKRLQDQNRLSDKDTVMTWLLHQCLFKTLEVWLPASQGGYLADELLTSLGSAQGQSRLVRETLKPQRLLELAYCMYADLERIDNDERSNALHNRLVVGSYREEQTIREKIVAYLLQLAELLAIDIRKLPEVLVDHIGLADPLTPEQVLQVINQARWNPMGRGRTLTVTCHHPAIDLALTDYVKSLDDVLSHMLRCVADNHGGMAALTGLPAYLQSDGIAAAQQADGAPVYQIPHVKFQLAHDEVRELLMGEQLYGDPMLAIRELYQNALDACRYRQARLQYLEQTGALSAGQEWEGRILFRQGKDENERAYIECEDNGIGMAMTHLSKCFARAGRRFADLPEFIEEQAEWRKCDPPIKLYPNSQFGVGVLSYFMLADEIEVETCRLDRDGNPGQRLQIRVPGSSGLFRVQKLGLGNDAGTRVRLYLNRTHHKGQLISCIETLRKLLWVAEFKTEVKQFGRYEIWLPNQLRHPYYPDSYCLNIGDTDIWWVPESEYEHLRNGCILSDGLWTAEAQPGFIFNLRQDYLPKLTVDRKQIVKWDRSWVRESLMKAIKPLLGWQYLDLNLLWKLERKQPQVALKIVEIISNEEIRIPLMIASTSNLNQLKVPVSQLGCFSPDLYLCYFNYETSIRRTLHFPSPWWLLPYRVILWSQHGLFKVPGNLLDELTKEIPLKNFPQPQPGDGVLLSADLHPERFSMECVDESIPPAHIIHTSHILNESLVAVVKRLQKFVKLGLKIPAIDLQAINKINIEEEDVIVLSRRIREINSFGSDAGKTQWRIPWSETRISAAQIVLAATRLYEPIEKTIRRLQKLRLVGLKVIDVDLEKLTEIKITPEDIIALSKQLDGQEAWTKDFISPVQIAFVADKLNEPIANTLSRFERFVDIGLQLPKVDLDALSQFRATETDVLALSIGGINQKVAWPEDYLPVAQIVQAAWRVGESLSEALERFQRFRPLGLLLPDVEPDAVKNIVIEREDAIAFSEEFQSSYSTIVSTWLTDQVTPAHLITAAVNLNESIADVYQRFQKFTPLGLKLPPVDQTLLQELIDTEDNVVAFSKHLTKELRSSNDLLQGNVHPTRIILAALALNEPLTSTLERFQRFAPVLGLTLPKGPPSAWQICTPESSSDYGQRNQ
ncbi:caspase family protein [Leptolyngbya cf. ectocarpi LEGE 11479]|uniref:Caspase family protein n=1 Tax=Leptolyngbya cf. ectocarpi LEGE 11479 TaxID=1828722 RepID=A0A928X2H1_LEPEC|nr:caspase family protein [Leptolyngbya ectocarpi]MBE9065318.1 caspase family protein [Leptolyngbya cf. ectocarpi LEGE 11479]